jgi:hypothetical protein
MVFFASLGLHLSIAATPSGDGNGFSGASKVFLVLSILFAVLVAYARYVVYFDVVRRLGGVGARSRFTWWFEESAPERRSWWTEVLRRLSRASWPLLITIGAAAVLAGLAHVAFLGAVAGAVGLFAFALLHQIQRGDL